MGIFTEITVQGASARGSITGQYCGKLLKFSAHSFEVLGIRYLICLNISYTWERTPFDVKDIWKWPSTM